MRNRITNWLLFSSVLIVSLILLEFGLRCSGRFNTYIENNTIWPVISSNPIRTPAPHNWYYTFPANTLINGNKLEFNHQFMSNSFGLNNKLDFFNSTNDSCLKILTLGDSFTEGVGAHPDSTWPIILEHELKNKGYCSEVYNGGVSGSDPWFEYVLLRDRLHELKPSLVIVAINPTDYSDFICRGGETRFKEHNHVEYRPMPSWAWIYSTLHITRPLAFLLGYDDLLFSENQIKSLKSGFIDDFISLAKNWNTLGTQHSFRTVFVFFPTPSNLMFDLSNTYMDYTPLDSVSNIITGYNSLSSINIFRGMDSIVSENTNYEFSWPIDCHYNSKGYNVMGQLIAKDLSPVLSNRLVQEPCYNKPKL